WIFTHMFRRGRAYRKKQEVNWCPSCLTVLADEQVILARRSLGEVGSGECERCSTKVIKKDLEQWFFRITKYAERLLNNLDKLDWSEKIKIAQRNWIGRSAGALIKFPLHPPPFSLLPALEVFTTRPDTLFGVTFVVVSPELAKKWMEAGWQASPEVQKYVEESLPRRTEEEGKKEKTGVFSGIYAVNPVNQEKVPVWVSDYVLAGYGTGAIMAVPAHDERDFEFAKKFKLPIRQVVAPYVELTGICTPRPDKPETRKNVVTAIIHNKKNDMYLVLRWPEGRCGFVGGGIEGKERMEEAIAREVREETGYINFEIARVILPSFYGNGFKPRKDINCFDYDTAFLVEIKSEAREALSSEDKNAHEIAWLDEKEVSKCLTLDHHKFMWGRYMKGEECFTGEGLLISSGKFDGMPSAAAEWEIAKLAGGEKKVQYRLRDWIVSRQRYWGSPIPMIFCEACKTKGKGERKDMPGWYAVPDKNLPVVLPFVKDFRPKGTGASPLASVTSFYEVTCPLCKGVARRETDVSDTFLDSAWYFLRYPSVKNKKQAWDPAITKKWLPVNMYIGGAEHAVLHLLYSRFLTMMFYDAKMLSFEEPFTSFRAHGLITKDGAKMSKSKGNVVEPDKYFKAYGADAMRMYLAFLAPFTEGGDFRDSGIAGITRFLARVEKLAKEVLVEANVSLPRKTAKRFHQAIRRISESIVALHYNVAISQLMILLSELEAARQSGPLSKRAFRDFLKLLAPFAPYISEELYQKLFDRKVFRKKDSIHLQPWPAYDPNMAAEDTFQLIVQVNGKTRGTIEAPKGIGEEDARELAFSLGSVKIHAIDGKPPKVIFVPDRLINFVI
ncbi:MAG: class I tRNA ligase family protein, partial [Patescibacteria group bacterium]